MNETIKEGIKYGINGVFTTLVNYLVFILLDTLPLHYLISNTIAWAVAVVFAYYTNRYFVFQSNKAVKEEILSFVSLRFTSLVVENIFLFLCVSILDMKKLIAKCMISIVVVVLNYVVCKTKIFNKGGEIHG